MFGNYSEMTESTNRPLICSFLEQHGHCATLATSLLRMLHKQYSPTSPMLSDLPISTSFTPCSRASTTAFFSHWRLPRPVWPQRKWGKCRPPSLGGSLSCTTQTMSLTSRTQSAILISQFDFCYHLLNLLVLHSLQIHSTIYTCLLFLLWQASTMCKCPIYLKCFINLT